MDWDELKRGYYVGAAVADGERTGNVTGHDDANQAVLVNYGDGVERVPMSALNHRVTLALWRTRR